jgi:hypothetical protein|tara:strand:+ start:983 stop:1171 length:189 start_codon:yes stop_codon:yes gene_type:complete
MNDLVNKESGESHSPFTDKELKIIKRLEGEVKTKGDSVALLFSDDEWDLWMKYNGGSVMMII